MYQYAIFPFDFQPEQPLEDLPVEMAAAVLRYLDGASLLNAAKTSNKLMSICKGDPLLRLRLQEQLKKELELRRRYFLDAGASVTVTRQRNAGLFKTNVAKKVTRNPSQIMGNMENLWTSKSAAGGKVKKTQKVRAGPYKSVRL